jgi:hypothetical protein
VLVFDFKLTRDPEVARLRIDGDLSGGADTDLLGEALALVQPTEHLVLNLNDVGELDSPTAILIHDTLMRRSVMAETVVVCQRERVSMQLVLHDVDRVSPIVRTEQEAMEIVDSSWSRRRLPHSVTSGAHRHSG